MTTNQLLINAKAAAKELSVLDENTKNKAILSMALSVENNTEKILKANDVDMNTAKGKINDVMLDRLKLTKERIKAMADGMREVAALPDPVGEILSEIKRPNGLIIKKTAVPLGVVAIIYESRPNVTSDAAVLTLKSGNVSVLKSGKDAFNSAKAIVDAMHEGLKNVGLPEEFVNLVTDLTHEGAKELMTAKSLVDLLIPRGGAGLISACVKNATVPCIETGTGICHIYIDKSADTDMALNIVENAKTSRPSVCNAEEVLLVSREKAKEFLPLLKKRLVDDRKIKGEIPVELRLCDESIKIIDGKKAEETDFDTEFLNYILAVKIVSDVKEAVEHISFHSTHHSDAIITNDKEAADYFKKSVDSSSVYVNASTRFTDGGEFGLGCEMGISTQKLHARGPMGLKELTTYKYIIEGNGNIR